MRKPAPRRALTKATTHVARHNANLRTLAEAALDDLKAQDIVWVNLEGKASFADALLIATATSTRHAASLATHVEEALRKNGQPILGVQGQTHGEWVLVDAGDLVIHIFQPDTRKLYNLEKLWSF